MKPTRTTAGEVHALQVERPGCGNPEPAHCDEDPFQPKQETRKWMKRLLMGLQSPWDKASPFLSTSLLTTAFFPLSLSAAGVLTQPLQLARPASLFWAQNVPRDAHSTHSCRAPYSVLGTQRGLRDVAGLGRTFFSRSANMWPLSERAWGQVLGLLLGYVLATLVWCRYICLSVCVAVGSPSPLETLAPVDLVHSMELEKGALGESEQTQNLSPEGHTPSQQDTHTYCVKPADLEQGKLRCGGEYLVHYCCY